MKRANSVFGNVALIALPVIAIFAISGAATAATTSTPTKVVATPMKVTTKATTTTKAASTKATSTKATSTQVLILKTDTAVNVEAGNLVGITAAHNAARISASAPNLSWSSTLGTAAQKLANECVFKHSDHSLQTGENLYATTSTSSAQVVVDAWLAEGGNYNAASNQCSGECGHRTQVLSSSAKRLGCGMARCTSGSPFGNGSWEMWACQYDPR